MGTDTLICLSRSTLYPSSPALLSKRLTCMDHKRLLCPLPHLAWPVGSQDRRTERGLGVGLGIFPEPLLYSIPSGYLCFTPET